MVGLCLSLLTDVGNGVWNCLYFAKLQTCNFCGHKYLSSQLSLPVLLIILLLMIYNLQVNDLRYNISILQIDIIHINIINNIYIYIYTLGLGGGFACRTKIKSSLPMRASVQETLEKFCPDHQRHFQSCRIIWCRVMMPNFQFKMKTERLFQKVCYRPHFDTEGQNHSGIPPLSRQLGDLGNGFFVF